MHIHQRTQDQGDRNGRTGSHFNLSFRMIIKALDGRERHLARRHLDAEFTCRVEEMTAGEADARVSVIWGIELAISRHALDASRRWPAGFFIYNAHLNSAHGTFPVSLFDYY